MGSIWREAGGEDLWSFPRYAHTLGTCFPSVLAVNPSLTIMALSLRAADRHLAQA